MWKRPRRHHRKSLCVVMMVVVVQWRSCSCYCYCIQWNECTLRSDIVSDVRHKKHKSVAIMRSLNNTNQHTHTKTTCVFPLTYTSQSRKEFLWTVFSFGPLFFVSHFLLSSSTLQLFFLYFESFYFFIYFLSFHKKMHFFLLMMCSQKIVYFILCWRTSSLLYVSWNQGEKMNEKWIGNSKKKQ